MTNTLNTANDLHYKMKMYYRKWRRGGVGDKAMYNKFLLAAEAFAQLDLKDPFGDATADELYAAMTTNYHAFLKDNANERANLNRYLNAAMALAAMNLETRIAEKPAVTMNAAARPGEGADVVTAVAEE